LRKVAILHRLTNDITVPNIIVSDESLTLPLLGSPPVTANNKIYNLNGTIYFDGESLDPTNKAIAMAIVFG